jgi:hypothetical protein
MKRMIVLGAAALTLAFLIADEASAQRRGFGGGGFGGMGGRGMAVGGMGGRGMAVGGRGIGVAGVGFRGAGYGIRTAGVGGVGYGIRTAGVGRGGGLWRPGVRFGGWRGGWGYPLAAGIGLGYYGGYSGYKDCLAWDGYGWVNVCYSTYPYGYY